MMNILVTLARRHSEKWAENMANLNDKMVGCLMPSPAGKPTAPTDNVMHGSDLHAKLMDVLGTNVLSADASAAVETFAGVKMAGKEFRVGSGLQLDRQDEDEDDDGQVCNNNSSLSITANLIQPTACLANLINPSSCEIMAASLSCQSHPPSVV